MSTANNFFSVMRGKARTGILVEGTALLAGAFVGYMALSFALDRTLRLELPYRLVLLFLLVVGVAHLLYQRLFAPLGTDLNDDELALALERGLEAGEGNLQQALISAVQFERVLATGQEGAESPQLMQRVVDQVYGRIPQIRSQEGLDGVRVARFSSLLAGCLLVTALVAGLYSDSFGIWARRNLFLSSVEWPRYSQLSFLMDVDEDGFVRVAEGNDLTVEVKAAGVIPEQVYIHYEFVDGTEGREPMVLTGDETQAAEGGERRFTWLMESVLSSATLYATGGDGLTEELSISLVKRPVLSGLQITKTYPAYMNREAEMVSVTEGDVRVPKGSVLEFAATSTKRLEKAFVLYGKDGKQPLLLDSSRHAFKGSFSPAESGIITIDVADRDGLGAGKPPKLFLRVVEDRAPAVEFKTRGIGSMIIFKAMIPGTLKIRDDYGLTKVTALHRLMSAEDKAAAAGDKSKFEPLEMQGLRQPDASATETEYEADVLFDFSSVNDIESTETDPKNKIRPGMLLALEFEARDNFGPGEPHLGKSDVLTLRVVTEEKLWADLHRRKYERRRELMQILEKEKVYKGEIEEIISPTSDDPRASLAKLRLLSIARAQRALQKRVRGTADRYRQILDEYFNNRIMKPGQVQVQRRAIQLPLEVLARDDFPSSAGEVVAFAHQGNEDLRDVAVSSYGSIIVVLEQVISNMQRLESIAGVLAGLRKVRKKEKAVKSEARSLMEKEEGRDAGKKDDKDSGPKKAPEQSPSPERRKNG